MLGREMKTTWRSVRESWQQLPRAAFLRWLIAMVVGALLCFGIIRVTTSTARDYITSPEGEHIQQWDRDGLLWFRDMTAISFTDGIIYESPGNLLIMIPVTLGAAVVAFRRRRLLEGLTIIISYVVARPMIFYGWAIWERKRPDLIADGAAALSKHSFPSGHALLACTTYGLLTWFWVRAADSWFEKILAMVLFIALLTTVSVGRLRLGAHWPTDQIAGTFFGLCWLTCCIIALRLGNAENKLSAT